MFEGAEVIFEANERKGEFTTKYTSFLNICVIKHVNCFNSILYRRWAIAIETVANLNAFVTLRKNTETGMFWATFGVQMIVIPSTP